jgi:hypothetical protein
LEYLFAYLALNNHSIKEAYWLFQIKDSSLLFLMKLKRLLYQMDWSFYTFLNRKVAFMACHISLDISRAANTNLDATINNILIAAQNWMV